MSIARRRLRGALIASATLLVAACAQRALPTAPSGDEASGAGRAATPVAPPKCQGQHTARRHASLTVTLSTHGGSFCIPEFALFGGSIKYPNARPPVQLHLISSTQNYHHQRNLGPGSPIFYLQVIVDGPTHFGKDVERGGGLTSPAIVPGHQYSIYAEADVGGFLLYIGPCYTTATLGKYGGVIGGAGKLLRDLPIPGPGRGIFEFYSGRQTHNRC